MKPNYTLWEVFFRKIGTRKSVFGLHRRVRIAYEPTLKSHVFAVFQGLRKVPSRRALWGGLLRIFVDFRGFWVSLGDPIWHHFPLKMGFKICILFGIDFGRLFWHGGGQVEPQDRTIRN